MKRVVRNYLLLWVVSIVLAFLLARYNQPDYSHGLPRGGRWNELWVLFRVGEGGAIVVLALAMAITLSGFLSYTARQVVTGKTQYSFLSLLALLGVVPAVFFLPHLSYRLHLPSLCGWLWGMYSNFFWYAGVCMVAIIIIKFVWVAVRAVVAGQKKYLIAWLLGLAGVWCLGHWGPFGKDFPIFLGYVGHTAAVFATGMFWFTLAASGAITVFELLRRIWPRSLQFRWASLRQRV